MTGLKITEPPAGKATQITTATTTVVTTGRSILQRITVFATVAFTITVQDSLGSVKAILPASVPVGNYELGIVMNGVTIITAGASNILVVTV